MKTWKMRKTCLLIVTACLMAAPGGLSAAVQAAQTTGALAEARQDFAARRFADAVTKLRSLIAAEPDNYQARYLLVRSLIRDKRPGEALAEAQAVVDQAPKEGYAQLALGDACFRNGLFEPAAIAYYTALGIDQKLPRAHLGFGAVQMSGGRRRTAKESFKKAFELDPNDTDIIRALAGCLPESPEETKLWERYAREATDVDPDALADAQAWVILKKSRPGPSKLITPDDKASLSIPLRHLFVPTEGKGSGLYVQVRVNKGRGRSLLLDTGASGILMLEKAARKDGVQGLAETRIRGIGDEGARLGSAGWADSVTIGDVRFENFPIEMVRKSVWGPTGDGIIGADVFDEFRLSIDPSNRTLVLEKLPELPDHDVSSYNAPSVLPEGFFKIRVLRSKILVDALIANKERGYVLLDTGGFMSVLSDQTARTVSRVNDAQGGVFGASGRVKRVFEALSINLKLAGVIQDNQALYAFDLSDLSDSIGVELKGLVGRSLLRHVVVTIDYRDSMIRLTPTPTGLRKR
jgi:tetratricopeptide (TPR) repeat protein